MKRERLLECARVQSRSRGTRNMQYTPVSCGTVHSFRDTRTVPYTPMSCGTGHSFRDTRMKRERLPVLCFGQNRERYSRNSEREQEFSKEAEGRPKSVVELCSRCIDE